jgi:hypothetical protein
MAAARVLAIESEPGDILSPSTCNGYLGCSAKVYFRKVAKLPDPPTGSLTMGSAVHAAIGTNFEQKLDTRQDLGPAGVRAIYLDAWDRLVKGEHEKGSFPTEFREDENPAELKAQGLALTLKYLEEVCPEVEPAAVEAHVAGRIGGVLVHGYIDLMDTSGRIIDLKTAARKPSEIGSDYRFQVATYSQLMTGASGEARVDTLVKTKTPQLVQLTCQAEQSDMDATARLYPLVQQSIRAGVWLPNRGSNLCSRKYCSFWRACQDAFGGKVSA